MSRKQQTVVFFAEAFTATRKLTDQQFGTLMRCAFDYLNGGQPYEGEDPAIDLAFGFISNQLDRYQEACGNKAEAARKRWAREKETEEAHQNPGQNPEESQSAENAVSTENTESKEGESREEKDAPVQSYPVLSHPVRSCPVVSEPVSPGPVIQSPCLSGPVPSREKRGFETQTEIFSPPTLKQVRDYCREAGYRIDGERFVNFYTSKGWMVGQSPMRDWKAAVRNWTERGKTNGTAEYQTYSPVGMQL